jgi:GNAT superfamily N-acetyltransferase
LQHVELKPKVSIQVERWATIANEVGELASAHFSEVEGPLEAKRPFKLNFKMMQMLDSVGVLRVVTSRVDGRLVGYCSWNVNDDIESEGLLIALQGALYVDPSASRYGLGPKMVKWSITYLRRLGVKCLFIHHRNRGRGKRLDQWFTSPRGLNAIPIKSEYFLWIGD